MSTATPLQSANAGDADFQQTVIDASHEIPVLVDFWAPWCGPCKVIGPVLEKLEGEYQGRFRLVKVNMDENQMLAEALNIQSIPAVKLIAGGAVKDEFVGALPEPEIRAFLDKNLPVAASASEDALAGLTLLATGQQAQAMQIFQAKLAENPKDPVALIGMSSIILDGGDVEQAKQGLEAVSEDELEKLSDKTLPERFLAALRARIFLIENSEIKNGGQDPAPGAGETLDARFSGACQGALNGEFEEALEGLLAIVGENRKFKDDGGRKAMLAVFDLLPPDSEIGNSYRNRLSSLLFS